MDHSAPGGSRASLAARLLLISVISVTGVTGVTGVVGVLAAGCEQPAPTARPQVQSIFHVKGMTCSGCEQAIAKALGQLKGVKRARVSHPQARAWVTHDPSLVSVEQLREAIQQLGYGAALLKTTKAEEP